MIKAINDKVIIRRYRDDNKTSGGIIIPNNTVHRYQVFSIGETVDRYLPGLNVGDWVVVDERYSTLVEHSVDETNKVIDYISVRCADIISVLIDDEK